MRHLIEPEDFTLDEIEKLVDTGLDIYENPKKYNKVCDGCLLYTSRCV